MLHRGGFPLPRSLCHCLLVDQDVTIKDWNFLVNQLKIKVEEVKIGEGHAVDLKLEAVFLVGIVRLDDPRDHKFLLLHEEVVGRHCELL